MHPISRALQPRQAAFTKILMFVVTELFLTLLGLDDMADMGEWEERRRGAVGNSQVVQII